jgi:secreted PhoX family phosphatase
MARTSIRRLVSPQPRPYERFLDVLRRRLGQRRPLNMARRRAPLLVLRTCEAHFYFGLLERGSLHAARFNDDGAGEWLPLTFGQGPLPTANGLALRADILINTRRSVDPPGAIRMEALDCIAARAINGKVCGPSDGADSAYVAGLNPQLISPVPSPHQIVFGVSDNLWVAGADQTLASSTEDGLYAVPVARSQHGYMCQFLSNVPGGTIAGLTFTPHNPPSFVPSSIQGTVLASRVHRAPGPSGPSPHVPV